MTKPRLLILNTIGLTGVELLLTELARHPEVTALPGQNFSMFEHNLYRPHDYSKYPAEQVFDSLSKLLYTREGRIWMGLTKHMTEEEKKAYPADRHKELFVTRLGTSRDFLDAVESFITSFHESRGAAWIGAKYLTFFSNNLLLNHQHYPRFAERATVIHLSCRIDRWLTIISQTRTWNCVEACKFWLVNSLYARRYGTRSGRFLSIYSDELADNPEKVMPAVREFLSVSAPPADAGPAAGGFIKRDAKWISAQRESADELRRIYQDCGLFQLAESFEDWAAQFLQRKRTGELLDKFARFWNSTSHTKFP